MQVKHALKEMFDWLMVPTSMKVVWKSATTTFGVQSVMTVLTDETVQWSAGNLDLPMQVIMYNGL